MITRDVAEKNNIHLGDVVTLDLGELGKDKWTVVGLYDPVFAGAFSADTIYAPAEGLYQATKKYNQGTVLYLRTAPHDAAFTSAVTTELKQLYEDRGLKVVQSLTQAEAASDERLPIRHRRLDDAGVVGDRRAGGRHCPDGRAFHRRHRKDQGDRRTARGRCPVVAPSWESSSWKVFCRD